jgi:hypothetical protein
VTNSDQPPLGPSRGEISRDELNSGPSRESSLQWIRALETELAALTGQTDLGWLQRAEALASLEQRFFRAILDESVGQGHSIALHLRSDLEHWSELLGIKKLDQAQDLTERAVRTWERAQHSSWLQRVEASITKGGLVELTTAIASAPASELSADGSVAPKNGAKDIANKAASRAPEAWADHEERGPDGQDSDASRHESDAHEEDPGQSSHSQHEADEWRADNDDYARVSREKLLLLRERFAHEQEFSDLPDEMRDTWVSAELDHAAEVLTAIDELSLERALGQLRATEDRLTWFLSSVGGLAPKPKLRLKMRLRRIRAEIQERELQGVLERRFGIRAVAAFERFIFFLILLVLGILAYEAIYEVGEAWTRRLLWIDTAACSIFLLEFFTKLSHVRGRTRWFFRHLLIDFVPSLPFGMILHLGSNPLEAGRAVRLLRLSRIARYMRPLLPFIRLMRALGFLARGIDRIVRSQRGALNRDLVLTPNRQERGRASARESGLRARQARLQAWLEREWRGGLAHAPREERAAFALCRSRALEHLVANNTERLLKFEFAESDTEERTVHETLRMMERIGAGDIAASLGPIVSAKLGRGLKLMARTPLRWLPIFRRLLPHVRGKVNDTQFIALTVRKLGAELKKHHGRLYWFTDLHGTITPSELVDRTGSALVKSSIRPASRLLLFGGAYVILMGLLQLIGVDAASGPDPVAEAAAAAELASEANGGGMVGALHGLKQMLERFVGPTLILLGSICLAILGIGFWLKRLAQDATSFFEQAGSAQFLGLTEVIRSRSIERDSEILTRRVLDPELKARAVFTEHEGELPPKEPIAVGRAREYELVRLALRDKVRAWLLDGTQTRSSSGRLFAVDRVALLYRDSLNGSLFGESDTRTTAQLLGNPSLLQMRQRSTRVDKRETKSLRALDLEKAGGYQGPYLWFSLLSRSIARSASRLIVEYNRNALTLEDLKFADKQELLRHEAWIRNHPAHAGPGPAVREQEASDARSYRSAAFNALHFLDDDPSRDHEIEVRFGSDVLELLRHDRAQMFCRIFGTYPLHLRARSERTLNLNRLYDEWMRAGRVFLLPLRVAALGAASVAQFAKLIVRAAREIRDPRLRTRTDPRLGAEFDSAARKIDRLRGPVVRSCVWLRARLDPEYLGLSIPGNGPPPLTSALSVDGDLEFISADNVLRRRIQNERRRAQADLERLRRLYESGALEAAAETIGLAKDDIGPEHRRAIAIAYRADYDAFRTQLSSRAVMDELLIEPKPVPEEAQRRVPKRGSGRAFANYCRTVGIEDPERKRAAWEIIRANIDDVQACLLYWGRHGDEGVQAGHDQLAEFLRHPTRISDQLVTLRSVQTLSLIDLLIYREHIWRLGRYSEVGDMPDSRLQLIDD